MTKKLTGLSLFALLFFAFHLKMENLGATINIDYKSKMIDDTSTIQAGTPIENSALCRRPERPPRLVPPQPSFSPHRRGRDKTMSWPRLACIIYFLTLSLIVGGIIAKHPSAAAMASPAL